MKKKHFKYDSEYSIGMYLNKYQFLQQTELELFAKTQKVFTEDTPCHLYFILKRPRLSLDKDYFVQDQDFFEFKYYIHVQDEKHERLFRIGKPSDSKNFMLMCEYPYDTFKITDNGKINANFKLAAILDIIHSKNSKSEPLLDYKVLYVGQAFGTDGKRTAIDRLGSHSTLQKIYSEAMQRNPDSEIWLMLAHFEEQRFGAMNGKIIMPTENQEENIQRFADFMNPSGSKFSEDQKINFTEAALIQTFLPRYNKEFKGTFPSPNHSSYQECYELGVNGIVVELDTTNVARWLYSDHLPRRPEGQIGIQYWQYGEFHFTTDKDRFKMFNNEYFE
ncbi:hypothetical protein [Maribacter arcticus]|uniref:Uncharacterized protein n=1 Tax=Maribacter arcticus TaxID=561365 RepID=A0A1T5AJG7_9FLAO|nr:hypothetical protein [Maribacter arcticus]SKB35141.1 hypothetical protein SAMN05660866_01033 [Maribacter arcticus]